MRAYVITVEGSEQSERGAAALEESCAQYSTVKPIRWAATTPDQVSEQMEGYGLQWTYPWHGETYLRSRRLRLRAYKSKGPGPRTACFLSHYRLWRECLDSEEETLILEDDALFVRGFDPERIGSGFGALGINDPHGATRKAAEFHQAVQAGPFPVAETPWVDDTDIPQGLAGNSAYILQPWFAEDLLDAVEAYGAWPNDALMCKQIFPGKLGVTKAYYTKVQGTPSQL